MAKSDGMSKMASKSSKMGYANLGRGKRSSGSQPAQVPTGYSITTLIAVAVALGVCAALVPKFFEAKRPGTNFSARTQTKGSDAKVDSQASPKASIKAPSAKDAPKSKSEKVIDRVFQNDSPLRADLYWKNDKDNKPIKIGFVESGKSMKVQSFTNHEFFWTAHGVTTPMVDGNGGDVVHRIKKETIKYTLPASAGMKSGCYDRYPEYCQSNAHSCDRAPGWMIVHCPVTCNGCDLLDVKVRCDPKRLGIDPRPIWKAGQLNEMFERIVRDYPEYNTQVLSSPATEFEGKPAPWVIVLEDFFDEDEADALIEGVGNNFKRSTTHGDLADGVTGEKQMKANEGRTSENAWCLNGCTQLPKVKNLSARIADLIGIPETHYEDYQVLQYKAGQFYNAHHDNGPNEMEKLCGPRILTFFLYLSDVEEGGTTDFTKLGISVKPKLGNVLLWPSVLDEDPTEVDWRMQHYAKPVTKGIKYAANHWVRLFDYKIPMKWGCNGGFTSL